MIQGQELELSLGLPIQITSFNDRMPRLCYPFKLKDLSRANIYLSTFDHKNIEDNVSDEAKLIALLYFLKESFIEIKEIHELLRYIDVDCFEELIKDMKLVSGISDKEVSENDAERKILGWQKSVNIVQKYTNNSAEDIRNMTLTQFNSLLEYIGIALNWDYKVSTISTVKEPNKHLTGEEHPLAPDRIVNKKNYVSMKDIMGLKEIK